MPAQATLGVLFARIKNYEKAAFWLHKAAEQGDPEAQYNLAVVYSKGQGVSQDQERAFHWFAEAAERGVVSAQARLGLMYATGDAVALDPLEAHKWLIIAADGGDKAGRANFLRSEAGLGLMQITEAKRRAEAWKQAHAAP